MESAPYSFLSDFPVIVDGSICGGHEGSNIIDSNYRRIAYERYVERNIDCFHRAVFKRNVDKFFASHRLWISLAKKGSP